MGMFVYHSLCGFGELLCEEHWDFRLLYQNVGEFRGSVWTVPLRFVRLLCRGGC